MKGRRVKKQWRELLFLSDAVTMKGLISCYSWGPGEPRGAELPIELLMADLSAKVWALHKYASVQHCEEIICLLLRRDCTVFQLLGLFQQRLRRLLWIMFTYLQPVYPEISEESSDARWTLCQTHLDFCLSFFFSLLLPTHTATLHSCWWMQLKNLRSSQIQWGRVEELWRQTTAAIFVANYKRRKWRNPRV